MYNSSGAVYGFRFHDSGVQRRRVGLDVTGVCIL
nr:MAG TPA: hypothetical protein [Bacteriophage sp.]